MGRKLALLILEFIRDMLICNKFTDIQIAEAANCHKCIIRRYRLNLRLFGSVKAPPNKEKRLRSLTPIMIQVLLDHLLEKSYLYFDEMAIFL